MRILSSLLLFTGFMALMGCSATEVRPGAERIIVTRQSAPQGCKFRGNIIGEQGGFFTGGWTSNKNLAQGALNDLKNKAKDLGANYVVLENTNAGNTGSGGLYYSSQEQTDVTHTGAAYACHPKAIGLI